ncbi:MAG: D-hexose-6-phosphate mutarotase [Verrucomicrobia bacterium]|nr:D-hexose-6-phosphate mutarotase [Verrucomicrobiota bacterium]MBU1736022.1 D-hexose-6-phosphate mutarotase [Verrucomicrobiota bacterium]MBU1858118.1 D-hexose-6-phosphate mutarotase [Verrucomicrobiota bacterium]
MNPGQLQQKYGIPDRVRFAEGRGQLVKAVLEHASGARAEIYLHGAHVTAWQTARGCEVLFVSCVSHFQDGVPIRGGIPVIFPQFGDGPLPKHGLVRARAWVVARTALGADGAVSIILQLEDDAQTRALWPHPFCLQLTISLGLALTLEFTVKNPGSAPFPFQTALHTYFQVADITQTSLFGLQGTAFEDFLHPGPAVETREVITFDRETDRIYVNAPDRVVLDDQGNKRKIAIAKSGQNDIVVWNPWIEKSKRLEDFGDDEYRHMVCVETGRMRAPVVLAPGAQWTGRTTLTCGTLPE